MGNMHVKKQMTYNSTVSDLTSCDCACLVGLELKYHWYTAFARTNFITDGLFMLIAKPFIVLEF
jgi:hypothetical protein